MSIVWSPKRVVKTEFLKPVLKFNKGDRERFFSSGLSITANTCCEAGLCLVGFPLRCLEGMGPKRFVLSVDDDTEFRSRCE